MKLKYEEGAAVVIPNADRNLVFAIYLEDEDGSNPEIAFEPIVAWAITPYVMRDVDRPSEHVETEFHSGKPIGCAGGAPEEIFDEKTARWWVPETASGEGLESLMQHFKDKRQRGEQVGVPDVVAKTCTLFKINWEGYETGCDEFISTEEYEGRSAGMDYCPYCGVKTEVIQ